MGKALCKCFLNGLWPSPSLHVKLMYFDDSAVRMYTTWDGYAHHHQVPSRSARIYSNLFKLCWLPTVFMSHDGLASMTHSLQHERTNCNLSTREHWVAAICTSLICTPPSLSMLMLTNRQKRRRPNKWHPYTSQTTRLFTPLTGSKSSTIFDGQIIIIVITSIIISSRHCSPQSHQLPPMFGLGRIYFL